MPKIWVDADACPKVIRDILFRASERTGIAVTLVANQPLTTPPLRQITNIQVSAGFDVADHYILQQLQPGDLVITADIPLAAEAIKLQTLIINPRGQVYTENNIRQRLAMRNFMEELRSTGQISGGPPPLSQTDRQRFANALDRYLTQWSTKPGSST